jgi:hypothetical protein
MSHEHVSVNDSNLCSEESAQENIWIYERQVTGIWRLLRNGILYNLNFSPNITGLYIEEDELVGTYNTSESVEKYVQRFWS